MVRRRRQFGNMLLSRTPILTSRHHLLPKYRTIRHNSLQRGALEGVIETPAGLLRVYSLHLADLIAEERLEQIAALFALNERAVRDGWPWSGADSRRSELWQQSGAAPEMPAEAIFMGDFNLEPGSPEYEAIVGPKRADIGRILVGHKLVDAWAATGHGEDKGVTLYADPAVDAPVSTRLDYCFVTAGLAPRLKDCWIDDGAEGSDHQPVWVEMDL
ncbi:MAG: endonuclease/exonuclease/phosphatase family protein [Pseudomonadota bacterium]